MMITSKYFSSLIMELMYLLPTYEKRVYIMGNSIKKESRDHYICGDLNKYSFVRNKFKMNNLYIGNTSISNLDFNCPIKTLIVQNCYMKNELLFDSETIEYLSINNCFNLQYLFMNVKSFDKLKYFSIVVRHPRFFELEILKKILELLPSTVKKIKLSTNLYHFFELNKSLLKNSNAILEFEKNDDYDVHHVAYYQI